MHEVEFKFDERSLVPVVEENGTVRINGRISYGTIFGHAGQYWFYEHLVPLYVEKKDGVWIPKLKETP